MLWRRVILRCQRQHELHLKSRQVHYIQGQSPSPKIREYFYYIDHQGQLFLDDAKMKNFTSCFKEKQFLSFFFKRLKFNDTGSYMADFPYLSPCGREKNFIRCDDLPVVYTQLLEGEDGSELFSYGGSGPGLTQTFDPESICMLPETGRVYHPGPSKIGGVGLVKSSLAIEFSKYFEFEMGEDAPPTHFTWKGKQFSLNNDIIDLLRKEEDRKKALADGNS